MSRKVERNWEGKKGKEKKSDAEPTECVFVFDAGVAKLKVVETGIQDNRYIEILSGIGEGEEVIVGPYATVSRELENGIKVKVEEEEEEEEED